MHLLFEMNLLELLVFYVVSLLLLIKKNSRVLIDKPTKPKPKIINNEFFISATKNIRNRKTYTEKRGRAVSIKK